MTTQLLIIWHSRTGAARQMAQAAAAGAQAIADELEAGARFDLQIRPADTVRAENLLAADGYLFAAPENLAALSGAMKECLDRNYYHGLTHSYGRLYSSLITAGSVGEGVSRQLERICTSCRLKAITPTQIVPMQAQTPEAISA